LGLFVVANFIPNLFCDFSCNQLEEGKKLVRNAIAAGVFNDLGSGNNIDLCVITKDGADYLRNYEIAVKRSEK
jgi:20S proteasome subunit beta 2